jgi:hypothetical protein
LTGNPVSEKCEGVEDLPRRTLRELLTLARERLGSAASGLKTKDELIAALSAPQAAPVAPTPESPPREVITRDFFRKRGGVG